MSTSIHEIPNQIKCKNQKYTHKERNDKVGQDYVSNFSIHYNEY